MGSEPGLWEELAHFNTSHPTPNLLPSLLSSLLGRRLLSQSYHPDVWYLSQGDADKRGQVGHLPQSLPLLLYGSPGNNPPTAATHPWALAAKADSLS